MALDGLVNLKILYISHFRSFLLFYFFLFLKKSLLIAVVLYFALMLIHEWYKIYGKKHVITELLFLIFTIAIVTFVFRYIPLFYQKYNSE